MVENEGIWVTRELAETNKSQRATSRVFLFLLIVETLAANRYGRRTMDISLTTRNAECHGQAINVGYKIQSLRAIRWFSYAFGGLSHGRTLLRVVGTGRNSYYQRQLICLKNWKRTGYLRTSRVVVA